MSDRIDAIRDRLAKATPGPWETVPTTGNAVASPDGDGYWTDVADRIESEPDADLIANAPADLAYLLAEMDKARAGLAEAWREGFSAGYADGTDTGPTSPDNPYKEAP